MSKLDRIIQMIRENMVANAPGASGGFSGSADPKGPVAGYDPTMKRRKYAKGGIGRRKKWLDYLRSSSNGRRN
jgi:hypothetical protein